MNGTRVYCMPLIHGTPEERGRDLWVAYVVLIAPYRWQHDIVNKVSVHNTSQCKNRYLSCPCCMMLSDKEADPSDFTVGYTL